jgi:S-DNA-T family DNA segregation ATPase FtsK/SpoIIIE
MCTVWWWHRWASWGRVKTRQAGRAPQRIQAWWQARLLMWHWRRKVGEGQVRSVTCDEHGHTLHLLAPGTVIGDIKVDRWESQLRLSQGALRVTQATGRDNAHRFDVRVLHRDPLSQPLVYPGGVKATIQAGVRLGRFEDGRTVRLQIRDTHILIAGVTGSGKSGTVNALLAELAWCPDVELWGGDLKGGMELGPWRDRFSRLEIAVPLVEEMLDELRQVIESRMHIQRNRTKGKRMWYPTERDPQIVAVIEEVARLTKPGLELLEQVAMIGRALGVTLVCTTQQPSARILGSTVLRSQLTTRIALRVGEKNEIGMVLDKGMESQGWRPDRFNREHRGLFLIYSDEYATPMPARSWWLDDETVQALVAATEHLRPGRPKVLRA